MKKYSVNEQVVSSRAWGRLSLDAFTADVMTSLLCSDLITLNDLHIDDLGPTGPSWCNCSTSIVDSPGATQHRGLMQSAEQPFIDQGQLAEVTADAIEYYDTSSGRRWIIDWYAAARPSVGGAPRWEINI